MVMVITMVMGFHWENEGLLYMAESLICRFSFVWDVYMGTVGVFVVYTI